MLYSMPVFIFEFENIYICICGPQKQVASLYIYTSTPESWQKLKMGFCIYLTPFFILLLPLASLPLPIVIV
jgi:hypothetical protein